jgi:hypothetical protein
MLELLNAIYLKFTSNGALVAAFPGGFHRDQAPENQPMPYLVSKVLTSKLQYSYQGVCRSETTIRLSAYGIGHDATGALAEQLVGAFDDALLTLASGTNDTVTRLTDPVPVLHQHDAQGNDVWAWSVEYGYGVRLA